MVWNKDFIEGSGFCRFEPLFSAHDLRVAKTLMNQLKHKLLQKIYQ